MSKGLSYLFTGTKGYIISTIANLPQNGEKLLEMGWTEISHPRAAASGHHIYSDPITGLRIRYDVAKDGNHGFEGMNHYHILNPNATSQRDMYLDAAGNPVRKGSKASHIIPKGD